MGDTIKTRLQVGSGTRRSLFRNLFAGVLPQLVTSIPSGAIFFGTKDLIKAELRGFLGPGNAELITVIAVGGAQVPYWLVRNPSEILKTKRQAFNEGDANVELTGENAWSLLKDVLESEGATGLYNGYFSNIAYTFPADAIKFLVFEALQRKAGARPAKRTISTLEPALYGSLATCVAQLTTAPLDVVRTRIMNQDLTHREYANLVDCFRKLLREE